MRLSGTRRTSSSVFSQSGCKCKAARHASLPRTVIGFVYDTRPKKVPSVSKSLLSLSVCARNLRPCPRPRLPSRSLSPWSWRCFDVGRRLSLSFWSWLWDFGRCPSRIRICGRTRSLWGDYTDRHGAWVTTDPTVFILPCISIGSPGTIIIRAMTEWAVLINPRGSRDPCRRPAQKRPRPRSPGKRATTLTRYQPGQHRSRMLFI